MESMKIIMWRYKYLLEIAKYRAQNCLIVYLDATWYDSLDLQKGLIYLLQSQKEKKKFVQLAAMKVL